MSLGVNLLLSRYVITYGGILTETDFAELYFAMGWDSVGGG